MVSQYSDDKHDQATLCLLGSYSSMGHEWGGGEMPCDSQGHDIPSVCTHEGALMLFRRAQYYALANKTGDFLLINNQFVKNLLTEGT